MENNQNKSEVEQYWNAICSKAGISTSWFALSHQEQAMLIQSINMLLSVLRNRGMS